MSWKRITLLFAVAVLIGVAGVLYWRPKTDVSISAIPNSHPSPSILQSTEIYVAPKTVDPTLADFVDRTKKTPVRLTSDLTFRFPSIQNASDVAAVVSVLSDSKDDDRVRNEAANLLERSKYAGLADALCKVLDAPHESLRFRSFAAQHLGIVASTSDGNQQGIARAKLLACLSDKQTEVRREALLALIRLKDEHAKQITQEWLHDLSPAGDATRDLTIRCTQELDLREEIPFVRGYLRDPNEVIQIAAIVALSQWGDNASRSAFEEAAQSKIVRVQRAGLAAIAKLKAKSSLSEPPAQALRTETSPK